MRRPSFFAQLPRPRVRGPHADLLGASDEGHLESGYADAAKLAGHSCPTFATAYILGHRALSLLYADVLPERVGVRIELAEPLDAGVTGVIASVLTLLTGAASSRQFKGIAGRLSRRDLQRFASLWHDRVRRLGLDHWDDPEVFPVRRTAVTPRGGS